jgi:hypothetical protein
VKTADAVVMKDVPPVLPSFTNMPESRHIASAILDLKPSPAQAQV